MIPFVLYTDGKGKERREWKRFLKVNKVLIRYIIMERKRNS